MLNFKNKQYKEKNLKQMEKKFKTLSLKKYEDNLVKI